MGLPGCWAVLLRRAVVVHPAGCVASSPMNGDDAVAFRRGEPLGTRERPISGLLSHGSVARVPTYRPRRHRRSRKAHYPVAGLGVPGRDSHPLDDQPNFRISISYIWISFPTDQHFLVTPPLGVIDESAQSDFHDP